MEHSTFRIIALIIVLAGLADYFMNDAQYLLFWAREMFDLLGWIAFWR